MDANGSGCKLVCVRACVKASVGSSLFVNMCVGVYESVVVYARTISTTLIGDVVELRECNIVQTSL